MTIVLLFLLSLTVACGTTKQDVQSILVKKILTECSEEKMECAIEIADAMPFSWDTLYVFRPGLLDVEVSRMVGKDVSFSEESSYKYVFLMEGSIVRTEEHHVRDFDNVPDGLVRFSTTDSEDRFALVNPNSKLAVRIDRRRSGTSFYLTCSSCSK